MYKLEYKATEGSPANTNTSEYSVWREEAPSEFEKALLIDHMNNTGVIPVRGDNYVTKQSSNHRQTVAIQHKGNEPVVTYTRKEAKEITFYSDGTYTVDEGTSHNYNDDYFKFEGPINATEKITINE